MRVYPPSNRIQEKLVVGMVTEVDGEVKESYFAQLAS